MLCYATPMSHPIPFHPWTLFFRGRIINNSKQNDTNPILSSFQFANAALKPPQALVYNASILA